ncbi:hypothetical protein PRIPAC_90288, partial [Pristionchus pacificus]|uniref:Uncharacterized protein n=1 Tax=Pristionchus pacificus TaxID=54126 RepID=A0A2A6CWU5_PRIPA
RASFQSEPHQSTMALLVILLSSLALTSALPCSCESSASEFTDLHFNCPIDNFCSDSLISGSCGKTCHSSGSFHSSPYDDTDSSIVIGSHSCAGSLFDFNNGGSVLCSYSTPSSVIHSLLDHVERPVTPLDHSTHRPTMTLTLRSSLEVTVVPDLSLISTMVDRCCVPTLLLPLFSPLRMLAMFPLSPVSPNSIDNLQYSDNSTHEYDYRLHLNKNTCAVSGGEDSSKSITSVSCKGEMDFLPESTLTISFASLVSLSTDSLPHSTFSATKIYCADRYNNVIQ